MNQTHPKLFSPYTLGSLRLRNRIVMAPMTRNRATGNVPNDLMVKYYSDRATAGLIITEGTSPAPDGLGYARIPGVFSEAQIAGWKEVTDAVHERGGKIFVQLMHTGRASHPLNLPEGAKVVAPSAIPAAETQIYTDREGMKQAAMPEEISTAAIPAHIREWVASAEAALEAGFDGVELHGANGYLLEQFLNSASNKRSDAYGGSPEGRNRLVLEVAKAVAEAIGGDKLGIRLSPFGVFNEMKPDDTTEQQYEALAKGLKDAGLLYIHIVDHASMGAPAVPQSVKDKIRAAFGETIILSGGYDAARAESDLEAGKGELVAFGRPFIANPDLVQRLSTGAELATPDQATFYTPGEKGYNDYPTMREERVEIGSQAYS